MAKVTGFLEHGREGTRYRRIEERVGDHRLALADPPVEVLQRQASA